MCHGEECQRFLKTGLSRINLADAGYQVVQVGFSNFEHRVIAGAVFSPATLPALALMADLPGGNDMFPLDTCGTIGIFAWDVAAGFQVDAVAVVFATAVELGGLGCVEFPGDFFGFAEGLWGSSMCACNGKKTDQCQ